MNSKVYLLVIERRVSREFANFHPDAIFQQDSAPCYKAMIITNCLKKIKIQILEWPENSSDLNPTENLWSIVKNRLTKLGCNLPQKPN